MNIIDFVKQTTNHKKILIVKDATRAKNLIKTIERDYGLMCQNIVCKTVGQLAEDVYSYINFLQNSSSNLVVISNLESAIIMKSIIRENIDDLEYFTNIELINLSMAKEIFKKADCIRRNGWKSVSSVDSSRIRDIRLIIELYESYLCSKDIMDTTALMRQSLDYLDTYPEAQLREHIAELCGGEVFGLFDDSDDNTLLEDSFILKLMACPKSEEKVVYLDKAPAFEKLDNLKGKAEFFKGYGSSNEANYAVNDIVANKIAFGDAMVVYTDSSQLPFIQAAFQGNEIPARFVSENGLNNNSYVSLLRNIIGWAQDDYSEEFLEKIFANKTVYVKGYFNEKTDKEESADDAKEPEAAEEEDEAIAEHLTEKERDEKAAALGYVTYNYMGGQRYFNHVLNARRRRDNDFVIGWGYDRNIEFLNIEKAYINQYEAELDPEDKTVGMGYNIESHRQVLKLHEDLLDVFKEVHACKAPNKLSVISVYDKLLEFVEKHTVRRDLDYKSAKAGLYRVRHILENEADAEPEKVLRIIDELLSQLGSSQTADSGCVTVKKFDSWMVLDRPYVYFLGLSLKNYQERAIESPVMRDEDWSDYVDGNAVSFPTIDSCTELKTKNLYRTLAGFKGDRIAFGYSYYDVATLCECSPSAIYRELLGCFSDKSIQEIPEFIYGNPGGGFMIVDNKVNTPRTDVDVDLTTSNSGLEKFVDCPLKYAYERRTGITPNEFQSRDNTWLNAAQRGSFFHSVAEEYVKECMMCSSAETVRDTLDERCLETIAKKAKEYYMANIPYTSIGDVDLEYDKLLQSAKRYFSQLHRKRHSSGAEFDWRIADAEYRFEGLKYQVQLFDGEIKAFEFSGIMDRVDYRISGNQVFIRVVDYKTGVCANKSKENNQGKLTQHMIYKAAILDPNIQQAVLNKIAEIEGSQVKGYTVSFDSFIYEFPMDDSDKNSIVIGAKSIEGVNLTRLKACLQAIKDENKYVDKVDLYHKLDTYKSSYGSMSDELQVLIRGMSKKDSDQMSDDVKHSCKYCDFRDMCYKKKVGEI